MRILHASAMHIQVQFVTAGCVMTEMEGCCNFPYGVSALLQTCRSQKAHTEINNLIFLLYLLKQRIRKSVGY